ncbi:MAG: HNH endonuclease signature motif containing protein [Pseudonocardia sp.]
MNGHVPIDPATARQLTALAPSLRRILTHPETGTVLSVGRTTYTVPTDLKNLVTTRDTTCRFPGCTHPAATSDLDHTVAWTHGGTTAAANLATLCRHHHIVKHQTRWRVRQVPGDRAPQGGELEWTSPTGRRYVTAPARPETTRHRSMPRGHEPPPY